MGSGKAAGYVKNLYTFFAGSGITKIIKQINCKK
jgi:hypothetical protein